MRLISVSVGRTLARTFYLLRVLLAPAVQPVAGLVAFAGLSMSGLIVSIGFFAHPPPDWNRLRYLAATRQVQTIREAVEQYRGDCGDYPPSGIGLDALLVDAEVEGWRGPYLKWLPLTHGSGHTCTGGRLAQFLPRFCRTAQTGNRAATCSTRI
jgi:hypothetical protein